MDQVEDEYKKVNNGEWGWRALRLMSRWFKKSLFKRPIITKLHLHQAQTDVNVVQSFLSGASFYINYPFADDRATSLYLGTTQLPSCQSTWRQCWARWPRRCQGSTASKIPWAAKKRR